MRELCIKSEHQHDDFLLPDVDKHEKNGKDKGLIRQCTVLREKVANAKAVQDRQGSKYSLLFKGETAIWKYVFRSQSIGKEAEAEAEAETKSEGKKIYENKCRTGTTSYDQEIKRICSQIQWHKKKETYTHPLLEKKRERKYK